MVKVTDDDIKEWRREGSIPRFIFPVSDIAMGNIIVCLGFGAIGVYIWLSRK
jgi:hypothetical protein